MSRVTLLADGGPSVGLGHLVRSAVLARTLTDAGITATLVAPQRAHAPRIESIIGHPITWAKDMPWSHEESPEYLDGADGVVIDTYEPTSLPPDAPPCLVLDDLAAPIPVADVVLDPAWGATAREAEHRTRSPNARLLLGPAYALLRSELAAAAPPRTARPGPLRVLLSLGGADPTGALTPLAKALAASNTVSHLDVLAPTWPHVELPPSAARHQGLGATDLRALLDTCDVAVTAGGQTLHEIARAGLPMIAVSMGADQRHNLSAVENFIAGACAGDASDPDAPARVVKILEELARDPARRHSMSAAASARVDGRGSARVFEIIRERWNL